MSEGRIDREKLRAALRKLGDERVFYMLDDAISLLQRRRSWRSLSVNTST
jgi:hypothetical protein